MSNNTITISRGNLIGNIIISALGAVAGALICLFALGLIWMGEGRINLAVVAAESVPAQARQIDPALDGQLVSVTGAVVAAPLGDDGLLAPGAYLRLQRQVEMYAWVEERRTERRESSSGERIERTTYRYYQKWTSAPESGDSFNTPAGHRNPPLPIGEATLLAGDGRVGDYRIDLDTIALPSAERLALSEATVVPDDRHAAADGYIFRGRGSIERPQNGDIRISYQAVPAGTTMTVFGAQRSDELAPFRLDDGDDLYRAVEGDRAAAIGYLSAEDTITDWIIRLASLLMLWVGIALVFGPLNAAISLVPALRSVNGCLVGTLSFVPAFGIWAVAELVAILAHNIWLLLAAVALAAVAAVLLARRYLPQRGYVP